MSGVLLRALTVAAMSLLPVMAAADDQAKERSIEERLAIRISIETSDGADRIARQISEKSAVPVELSSSLQLLGITK